jgi:hypothetical protein
VYWLKLPVSLLRFSGSEPDEAVIVALGNWTIVAVAVDVAMGVQADAKTNCVGKIAMTKIILITMRAVNHRQFLLEVITVKSLIRLRCFNFERNMVPPVIF